MDNLLLIAIISILNIVCFFLGAKIGQKTVKGEDIKLPNPVQAVEQYKETKQYKEEQERLKTVLNNIDTYDGSNLGQKKL